MWDDFSLTIAKAVMSGQPMSHFYMRWMADPNLTLNLSKAPVTIPPDVAASLQPIYQHTRDTNDEVAFTALIEPREMQLIDVLQGEFGDSNMCDWDAGDLLERTRDAADGSGLRGVLGHTHPVKHKALGIREYNSIPSWIYFTDEDLAGFGTETGQEILKTRLHDRFGGDYCEMFIKQELYGFLSPYNIILSPRLDSIGFFSVQPEGVLEYHPIEWE
jgi:hypothetical protein